VIDLGTGDGRAVLERARREPRTLVIGVDASAAAMAESSRRAARSSSRGGQPNAVFVVAAAEQPPDELVGIADELLVTFPWGSLLAGAVGLDAAAAGGVAALLKDGGHARILASVVDADRLGLRPLGDQDASALADRWACHGLTLAEFRPATPSEIDASRSSWARRLAAGRRRPVWRIELVKAAGRATSQDRVAAPAPTDARARAR
jgi:16S rRNA (adenine(1408)-N(1))-methyltransferase